MTDRGAPSPRRRAVLEVLAAAVLFGTTGTTATLAPASASVASLGAARLVIGGAVLLLVLPGVGGSRRTALRLGRSRWGLAGALMVAAFQLAFFAGVSGAGVALATLVTIGSGPVFVGLLSWPLLRERPTRPWWLTTLVCIGGLLLLTADGGDRPGVDLGGILLALGAGFAYALYTVSAKRLMSTGAASEDAMACLFGIGGLLLLPVLLASGLSWLAEPSGVVAALWLGAATIAGAYVLFGRGLRRLPAGVAATLVLAEPLVATALGVVLLGERLGLLGWAGAALVAFGLAAQGLLATRSR